MNNLIEIEIGERSRIVYTLERKHGFDFAVIRVQYYNEKDKTWFNGNHKMNGISTSPAILKEMAEKIIAISKK
jgi:hypothetical protein